LQIATVEVPEEHMGPIVELFGKRRGHMFNMGNIGSVNYLSFPYIFLCQFVNTFSLRVLKLWTSKARIHVDFLLWNL